MTSRAYKLGRALRKDRPLSRPYVEDDQSSEIIRWMMAPSTPPTMGATQKIHSCCSAHGSAKRAAAVERAGFTEVLDTGIDTRWISVRARPMASGAKPAGDCQRQRRIGAEARRLEREQRGGQRRLQLGQAAAGIAVEHVEDREGGDEAVVVAAANRRVKKEVSGFLEAGERAGLADAPLDIGMAGLPIIGFDLALNQHGIGSKETC